MSSPYAGSVAVVTGAASGIGHATASRLIELGARVIGLDRDVGAPQGVDLRVTDVTDRASVLAALADLTSIDRLFNCAGVTGAAGPETTLRVNVFGLRDVIDMVLPLMPDGGSITNIASVGGWKWDKNFELVQGFLATVGIDDLGDWCTDHAELLAPSAYPFSKQCVVVETLLRCAELAPREIRVNAICPGLVDTPMLGSAPAGRGYVSAFPLPFGRMTTADEQASVLVYLGGPDAGAVSGVILPTDQGLLASVRVGALASPFGDA
ncbi:coniferyl-alcohol dehydrogenase [Aeromicrobium panaciterrae]|uniref:SDR family oxidoreductase n=1 Tax=Aeromicrobium panaciterrae TaxID=363861 RepID=UPI0031CFB5B1